MGIGLVDIDAKDCMMLRAHQSLSSKELSLRSKTMVDYYISVIKRYRKELLELSTLIVADAYFSTSTFANGIKKEGFSLISRLRDNACLFYIYNGPRTGKLGRSKTMDGLLTCVNLTGGHLSFCQLLLSLFFLLVQKLFTYSFTPMPYSFLKHWLKYLGVLNPTR